MCATSWALILNAIKAVTLWLFFFFVCLIRDQCLKEFLLDSHLGGRVQMSISLGVGSTHECLWTPWGVLSSAVTHCWGMRTQCKFLHHIWLWVFQCETAQWVHSELKIWSSRFGWHHWASGARHNRPQIELWGSKEGWRVPKGLPR